MRCTRFLAQLGQGWNVLLGTSMHMHARCLKKTYAAFVAMRKVDEDAVAEAEAAPAKAGKALAAPQRGVFNILVYKAAEDATSTFPAARNSALAAHFGAASPHGSAPRAPVTVEAAPADKAAKKGKKGKKGKGKGGKALPGTATGGSTRAAPKAPSLPAAQSGGEGVSLQALRAGLLTAGEAVRMAAFPAEEVAKVEAAVQCVRGDMSRGMRLTVARLLAMVRCLSLDQDAQTTASSLKELLTRLYGSSWHVISGSVQATQDKLGGGGAGAQSPFHVDGVVGAVTASPGEAAVFKVTPTHAARAPEAWAAEVSAADGAWAPTQPWWSKGAAGKAGEAGAEDAQVPQDGLAYPAAPAADTLRNTVLARHDVLYVYRPRAPAVQDVAVVQSSNTWSMGRAAAVAGAFAALVIFFALHALVDTGCASVSTMSGLQSSRWGSDVLVPGQGAFIEGEWVEGWSPPPSSSETLVEAEVDEEGEVDAEEGGAAPEPLPPSAQQVVSRRTLVTCDMPSVQAANRWVLAGRYALLAAAGLFMISPAMRYVGK